MNIEQAIESARIIGLEAVAKGLISVEQLKMVLNILEQEEHYEYCAGILQAINEIKDHMKVYKRIPNINELRLMKHSSKPIKAALAQVNYIIVPDINSIRAAENKE
jgi:hypothetical protein